MSIKVPADKTPQELQEYLKVCQAATINAIPSYDIDAAPIPDAKEVPLLPPPPPEPDPQKNSNSKPASEKQLKTALNICKDKKIHPDAVAKQYGASRLEDVSGADMWQFLNENIKSK